MYTTAVHTLYLLKGRRAQITHDIAFIFSLGYCEE
jgi:hypothetical protein